MNAFLIVVISIADHQHFWPLPTAVPFTLLAIYSEIFLRLNQFRRLSSDLSCAYCVPHFIQSFVENYMNTLNYCFFLSLLSTYATLFRFEKRKRQFTYILYTFLPYLLTEQQPFVFCQVQVQSSMTKACASRMAVHECMREIPPARAFPSIPERHRAYRLIVSFTFSSAQGLACGIIMIQWKVCSQNNSIAFSL